MRKPILLLLVFCMLIAPLCALAAGPLADGQYTVEAALSGGSGRASVASPAELAIQNGVATATVIWSSPHYEYMLVNGETYYPMQKEGNSTFKIPVTLDTDISFSAQTVAMSQPHVIEYTLRFDSSTLKPLRGGLAATDTLVWGILILVLVLAGVAWAIAHRGKRATKS